MLFTELRFWVFFAAVGIFYLLIPHRAQNRMLLVASYIFYGAWDWRFLSLILISTAIDYFVGLQMDQEAEQQKRDQTLNEQIIEINENAPEEIEEGNQLENQN